MYCALFVQHESFCGMIMKLSPSFTDKFGILLSVFKFAWLASFGLKYPFKFFTQRQDQPGKFEYRQKNTKIAAIYESSLLTT